jgi:hypothetical protein
MAIKGTHGSRRHAWQWEACMAVEGQRQNVDRLGRLVEVAALVRLRISASCAGGLTSAPPLLPRPSKSSTKVFYASTARIR